MAISCLLSMAYFMAISSKLLALESINVDKCEIYQSQRVVRCYCRSRNLSRVPIDCPENTTILDIGENDIRTLPNHSFTKWKFLQQLIMDHCAISVIEEYSFSNLLHLEILDMGFNNITTYPDEQLSQLSKLKHLVINGIDDNIFGKGFTKLKKLESVRLSPCYYSKLMNDTFINFIDSPITFIQLKCKLSYVHHDAFRPLTALTSIDISENLYIKISSLIPALKPFKDKNITSIYAYHNNHFPGKDIITVELAAIFGEICVSEINIQRNQISEIESGSFKAFKYKNCLKKLYFSENFIEIFKRPILLEIFVLSNLTYIDVSGFDRPSRTFTKVKRTNRYEKHLPSMLLKIPPNLKFANLSNQYAIHASLNMNITIQNGSNLMQVDLANSLLQSCHGTTTGAYNLRSLNVSGSNCYRLSSNSFDDVGNLRELIFQNSLLSKFLCRDKYKNLFGKLEKLTIVDISRNAMKCIHPNVFDKQKHSLNKLIIDNNNLERLPVFLQEFVTLKTISLRNNKIEFLNKKEMDDIDKTLLKPNNNLTILLENNPIKCNCDSVKFVEWIFDKRDIFENYDNYSCIYMDGTIRSLSWAYSNLQATRIKCISETWMFISVALASFFTISLIISVWMYKYRLPLKYWYYNIRRKYRLLGTHGQQPNQIYDAFVGYHHSDYNVVRRKFVRYLEEQKGLKLCIHQRDFIAGVYIGDNIMNAIKQSRKTIFIMTHDFLNSEWGKFELDMARMEMFKEDKDFLIVVMLEEIPPSEMPECLLDIWQRITCLEYDECLLSEDDDPSDESQFWKRFYESIVI